MTRVPIGNVRAVLEDELEAWCACPQREGDEGHEAWCEGERAWVARYHASSPRLYAFVGPDGAFLGKYDVAFDQRRRWTLWAPTVRRGPGAREIMARLCEHMGTEAKRQEVRSVEVILEEAHPTHDLAKHALGEAGFMFTEARLVVVRNLANDLPEPLEGLEISSGSELDPDGADESFFRAVGMDDPGIEEAAAHDKGQRLWWVGSESGRRVGMALASSVPGDEMLTEYHLGLVEDARGRGLGQVLLHAFLRGGRDAGAKTYVGSCARGNRAARVVLERAGCVPLGTRLVFHLTP